jgi:ABC-2 type transport system permease protein
MPTAFILIMSLAMQDTFSVHSNVQINYFLIDADQSPVSEALIRNLQKQKNFSAIIKTKDKVAELQNKLQNDDVHFLLIIPKGFGSGLEAGSPLLLQLTVAPSTQRPVSLLFESLLAEQSAQLWLQARQFDMQENAISVGFAPAITMPEKWLMVSSAAEGGKQVIPSSVQQSVPAWMVFAMFFIAIPLSNTLIVERQQRTLSRLLTMNASPFLLLAGKFIPFFFVNLIQVVLMILVGYFLVPLFGGDQLTLGNSPAALFLMACAVSFAAVGFALFIANLARTTEQATIFAAVSNIILAAIGGVMVPRFIMPPAMQELSLISPLAWGLEGFLDVFLRQGGVADILPEMLALCVFGLIMTVLSMGLVRHHSGSI